MSPCLHVCSHACSHVHTPASHSSLCAHTWVLVCIEQYAHECGWAHTHIPVYVCTHVCVHVDARVAVHAPACHKPFLPTLDVADHTLLRSLFPGSSLCHPPFLISLSPMCPSFFFPEFSSHFQQVLVHRRRGRGLVLHIKGKGIVLASAMTYVLLSCLKHMTLMSLRDHPLFDRGVGHRNQFKCNDN